jgi:hypothetical protein
MAKPRAPSREMYPATARDCGTGERIGDSGGIAGPLLFIGKSVPDLSAKSILVSRSRFYSVIPAASRSKADSHCFGGEGGSLPFR